MKRSAQLFFLSVLFLSVFLFNGPRQAYADYEAMAHWVENYGGEGECSGDDMTNPSDYFAEWYQHVYPEGQYEYDFNYWSHDTAVDKIDFIEDGDHSYPNGTDWADALFVMSHGTHSCSASPYWSRIVMGDDNGEETCRVYQTSEIFWGNGGSNEDANAVLFFVCGSVQLCVWEAYGYHSMRAGAQFNVLNGWHGTAMWSWWGLEDFEDYMDAVEFNGIGDDWVEELTTLWIWPYDDDCATAVTWGSSEADMDDNYYYSGFKDFHSTGSGYSAFYYIEGCDPASGEEL
jgi:hypothetical protein